MSSINRMKIVGDEAVVAGLKGEIHVVLGDERELQSSP